MTESASPSATRFASLRCQTRALNAVMLPSLLSVAIPLRFRHDCFWANVYFNGDFSCNFDNTAWIKHLNSIRNSNMTHSLKVFALIHSGVLLSKQVNYNQVVVKCQILQECFLQNFNMQKFHYMEHSNSRTFKDFQGPWIFYSKFKDFQGLLKDPMNPVCITI